jgi:D-beta-D-heptose 7-phosphate kinase/D-beta-D-heptose 1-phosphate adenosyltransferase
MRLEIPSFENVRVLVVGDLMLDRYWHGDASRISPEAPVPVLHVTQCEERPGGAGNVALNLAELGCKTTLLSVAGDDAAATTLENQLTAAGITCQLHRLADFPTITKLRVSGRNQQLVRLDFESALDALRAENLIPDYKALLSQADIVILSDYGKGTLHHSAALIAAAKEAGVPVLVDPKSLDFSIYRGATMITPNLKEFTAVVGRCPDEATLVAKGYALMREHQLNSLLITRSEHGMTLLREGSAPLHLPTHAREVYDVTGAGDTVISVLAACLAAGATADNAARLSNIAAGLVVRKAGAATVSVAELRRAIQRQESSHAGVLTEEELLDAVEDARAHGETVVMTNGCFDILHAGHVQYLEEAKALGRRLIVAVNDDASVQRLKGSNRPINSLPDRMAVLAALRAVDWVVPFGEDTPERLIKRVSPHILVKGQDYQTHQIAGADFVLAQGGQVKTLPLVPNRSTSKVVEKIIKTVNS